jgi:hypothetical protein
VVEYWSTGVVEWWSGGVVGKKKIYYFQILHYSIIPLFQYSVIFTNTLKKRAKKTSF